MRPVWFIILLGSLLVGSCIDPEAITLRGRINLVVVDGSITNLAEEQTILLSRAISDPLTGRTGSQLLTKAHVVVVVDSAQQVRCEEITDGTYRLPSDFKGQVGHAYQLRFMLSDGTQYASIPQVMQPVGEVARIYARFNEKSLFPPINTYYTSGHDVFIDTQDPADQRNFYRWDWLEYEPQYWCRTCASGFYSVYNPVGVGADLYVSGPDLYEACYYPVTDQNGRPYTRTLDYPCRSQCWEILRSHTIILFDDQYTNGGLISNLKVAAIPFYQHGPCSVSIRQSSLTPHAYRYFSLLAAQTQNTGGLVDTPPTALVGNVHNTANTTESVVGYFSVSAVATKSIYIDRNDYQGYPLGYDVANKRYLNEQGGELFFALNHREPTGDSSLNGHLPFIDDTPRPPTALCAPLDQRTPSKPPGWPN